MALILIVDDSPTEVHVTKTAPEKHGYQTATPADGAEGIRLAKSMKPDLIFMDVVMPGVNGFQATRTLANDPETRRIPVIMVTSKAQETDRIWGMRQGAVDYLVKPVSAEQLVEKAQAARGGGNVPSPPPPRPGERAGGEGAGGAGGVNPPIPPPASLRELSDRPFELLRELERRGRAAAGGRDAVEGREWVGVAFRLGAESFLVAREETREVMALPPGLTRVPRARGGSRGL